MDMGLQGKVAIVTGASKGIGWAITRALVEEGVFVIAGARNLSGELAALTEAGTARGVSVDLSTAAGVATLAAAAVEREGVRTEKASESTRSVRVQSRPIYGSARPV